LNNSKGIFGDSSGKAGITFGLFQVNFPLLPNSLLKRMQSPHPPDKAEKEERTDEIKKKQVTVQLPVELNRDHHMETYHERF